MRPEIRRPDTGPPKGDSENLGAFLPSLMRTSAPMPCGVGVPRSPISFFRGEASFLSERYQQKCNMEITKNEKSYGACVKTVALRYCKQGLHRQRKGFAWDPAMEIISHQIGD